MSNKKVLVVVDYQNDFIDGALANSLAEPLAGGIEQLVKQTLNEGNYVVFTKDTHEENYLQTREGKHIPLEHCMQGTKGHELHESLENIVKQDETGRVFVYNKYTFGGYDVPNEIEKIFGEHPCEISVCGVVSEICVLSNAVLLHSKFLDAKINVYENLCAGLTKEKHENAMSVLGSMGYNLLKW